MSQKTTVQGYLLSIASFFVIIAGMREASSLVVTFLLAFFVAIILTPGLRWLQARRVSTPVALLVIIALVGTIGGGVVAVVGQSANQLVQQLPSYQLQLQSKANEIEKWITDQAWAEWLLERKIGEPIENDDPSRSESGNGEPGDTKAKDGDASVGESLDPELGNAEPKQGEPGNSEPGPSETGNAETGNAEKKDSEPPSDEQGNQDDNSSTENGEPEALTDTDPANELNKSERSDSAGSDRKAEGSSTDDAIGAYTPAPFESSGRASANTMGGPVRSDNVSQLLSLEPADAVDLMKRLLADLGGLFSSAFLILLTVIFILLETARFPAKLQAAVGDRGSASEHIREMVDNIRRYMFIKTSTSLLTGLLVTAFLLTFNVRYAMLWGLLAFLFNYVPNIGSILAAGPAVALVFIEHGITMALMVGVGYLIINFFISYAIEPRFMGQGLGLSTLVVFLSLIFWGWVLGPIGMLLSAPLTMIVKIILADFEETRWIAVMLSAKAPAPADDSE